MNHCASRATTAKTAWARTTSTAGARCWISPSSSRVLKTCQHDAGASPASFFGGCMNRLFLALIASAAASAAGAAAPAERFAGVDLSYVNEMEACGAEFRVQGRKRDPHELFAAAGANLVRLRLWNAPDWTNYSTEADVTRAIGRAHKAGMKVLLDFHYSDDWADPQKQKIGRASCRE